MAMAFKKATRSTTKLRAAVDGPAGAGKSFTALRLAFLMVQAGLGRRVAVIDTEHGSAAKYAGENPDGVPWDFDTLELGEFSPLAYVDAMQAAATGGYDIWVVDSLSHAWTGTGGALDMVDKKTGNSGNKYTAWRDVTPMHNRMVEAIIQSPAHVICTMRSKTEYVLEPNERGKMVPRKIGTSPVQRDGMEYEFDVYGSLDLDHHLKVSKTRCRALDQSGDINPGPRFFRPLLDWLKGTDAAPPAVTPDQLRQAVPGLVKGSDVPPPQPKTAHLPASGEELHRRLKDYDAKLAAQKVCPVGALLAHVAQAGLKAGYGDDITAWTGAAIPFATDAVKEFEATARGKVAAK